MSRIRTIKPEFWTNARVIECSVNARLLFIGLWNFCDDCGNHPAAEKTCKGLVFPSDNFTNEEIHKMLSELESNGLIELYVVDNKHYLHVIGWEHQKINRPQPPKFPRVTHTNSVNAHGTFTDGAQSTEHIGDKGREKKDLKPIATQLSKKPKNPRTQIGEDEQPVEADLEFARKTGMDSRRIREEWEQFRDHHRQRGNAMADWRAAWRTWVRNCHKFAARAAPSHGRSNGNAEFMRWVVEDFCDDGKRGEKGTGEVIPMLQRERK